MALGHGLEMRDRLPVVALAESAYRGELDYGRPISQRTKHGLGRLRAALASEMSNRSRTRRGFGIGVRTDQERDDASIANESDARQRDGSIRPLPRLHGRE